MGRLRRDRRGQFVVLAAVIIAAFMFSMVLSISQLSTSRLEMAYEPVDEVVLTVASDFERAMRKALAEATQNYSKTWNANLAGKTGEEFIQGWLMAAQESYSGFGINIVLAPENSTGRNVDWIFDWGEGEGKSYVYTTFTMDVNAYGLRGLALTMERVVRLKIIDLDAEIELLEEGSEANVTIRFEVKEGGEFSEPLLGLTSNNIKIYVNGGDEVGGENITDFEYNGQGTYRLRFTYSGQVIEVITLMVTTGDGIIVAAGQKLRNPCIIELLSNDETTTGPNDNGGQFIINGTEYSPPGSISLFPGKRITISFIPPKDCTFIGFSASGPLNLTPGEPGTMVEALRGGRGKIIALYRSSEIAAPEYCYLTLRSREEGGENTSNKGKINLNGTEYSLASYNVEVPYNQTLSIAYYPEGGYEFMYWELEGSIFITNSGSTEIRALGNGTVTAVYKRVYSRPGDWRVIYITPEKGETGRDKNDFTLTLNPSDKYKEIQPISYGQISRRGDSESTTPKLDFGSVVKIILYARASSREVHLKVTLGFYNGTGQYIIGSGEKVIAKSNNHQIYEITFAPNIVEVPDGSTLFLIFERSNTDPGGGTLHILCGPEKTRIELW